MFPEKGYADFMYDMPLIAEGNAEVDISAGAADNHYLSFPVDVVIHGFYAREGSEAVGAILTGTAAVVSLDYTATGSTRTEMATISFPTTGTYGLGLIHEPTSFTAFHVLKGEPLVFEHKTAANAGGGGGSVAGQVTLGVYYKIHPSAS